MAMRFVAAAATVSVALLVQAGVARADEVLERGKYLAAIMDCGGCHTRGALAGKPDPTLALAGSDIGFHIPGVGIFYPPNLTPDDETGLGLWSEAEIIDAIRVGARPDGRQLVPVMPYPAYSALTDEDASALAAYLKSIPAVAFADEPGPTAEGAPAPGPYLTPAMP